MGTRRRLLAVQKRVEQSRQAALLSSLGARSHAIIEFRLRSDEQAKLSRRVKSRKGSLRQAQRAGPMSAPDEVRGNQWHQSRKPRRGGPMPVLFVPPRWGSGHPFTCIPGLRPGMTWGRPVGPELSRLSLFKIRNMIVDAVPGDRDREDTNPSLSSTVARLLRKRSRCQSSASGLGELDSPAFPVIRATLQFPPIRQNGSLRHDDDTVADEYAVDVAVFVDPGTQADLAVLPDSYVLIDDGSFND